MLLELRVQNLLLIESAELPLDPGLNVITGETGAGKTMLAHALDLLLGGKPRRGHRAARRRGGLRRGRVRAAAPGSRRDPELAELAERVAARRGRARAGAGGSPPTGRTRAYLQGRSVSASELRAVGIAAARPSTASTSTAG